MILGEMGSPGGGGSSDVGALSSIPIDEAGGGGGSRWPRQQTLALLKIRSCMDTAFKEASLKAPLWEEVSRKMAELGFQRSAKKCREKFENVYKYHKRTKDGRASKSDGKTYKFFQELEALEQNPFLIPPPPPPPPPLTNDSNPLPYASSLPTSPTPLTVLPPSSNPSTFQNPPISHHFQPEPPHSHFQFSSSSSDRRRGRKRKWKDYLKRLISDVVNKQEELHKRFLEALEKVDRDRISREEAWRVQEMERKNREHDLLVQERSLSAAKDAAVVAFLHKITADPQLTNLKLHHIPTPAAAVYTSDEVNLILKNNSGSSSRWPKAEVLALINLRTNMDLKYQDGGSKGSLWEDISVAMAKLGYNRSSKRCKEKWENINKYYKKVKESNKKRAEDSKTCPYFHQLEAIYKGRFARNPSSPKSNTNNFSSDEEEEEDDEMENEDGGGFEMILPPSDTVTTTTTTTTSVQ